MNYALDAVWWRLRTPIVRDLASLLTAPPPWHSAHELSIALLLGDSGFRYLLALDNQAEPLYQYVQNNPPIRQRLGSYAERLLAFWLSHAPHTELIWQNFCIRQRSETLGELDFLARINDQIFHIELACKYYGSLDTDITKLVGLNTQDRYTDKMAKLTQQMARLSSVEVQTVLNEHKYNHQNIQSVSVLRGMIFTPNAQPLTDPCLNRLGWMGYCLCDWAEWAPYLSAMNQPCCFAPIDKMHLLAPLKLNAATDQLFDWSQIQDIQHGMVAVLVYRQDGYWHEVHRIMKMNPTVKIIS